MEPPTLSFPPMPLLTPAPAAPAAVRRRHVWRWIALGVLGVFMAGAVTVYQSFRASDETRLVRQTILEVQPGGWSKQMEFGVGRLPVAAAQWVLRFVPMDPAARTAVQSLRRADVAIYQRLAQSAAGDSADLALRAREALARRGWEPVVAVGEAHESVLVLMPKAASSLRRFNVCVMVLDEQRLVVASVGANLETVMASLNAGDLLQNFGAL
ncbi:MAG: hypothetical protein JNK85_25270 [Verrucomicrobiales bacterium]|nr:hypothetical protein [Verrucomicrobiales bacterium]